MQPNFYVQIHSNEKESKAGQTVKGIFILILPTLRYTFLLKHKKAVNFKCSNEIALQLRFAMNKKHV